MKCPMCDAETWRDLDGLRNLGYWYDKDILKVDVDNKIGFVICESCGYVTYQRYHTEAEMRQFYRDDYRVGVNAMSHITCNRKNAYHEAFLAEWLAGRKKDADKTAVLDHGCAQGALLEMLRRKYGFKNENLVGTELTTGFREFGAKHWGLDIREDVDESRKYDLFVMYHTLEHFYDPVAELARARRLLKDGGVLYVSTPVWFGRLECAGGEVCADFEHLYHLNHINVFSMTSVRNLMARAGFSIVKENTSIYGYTFLAQKGEAQGADKITKENPDAIVRIIERQKRAIELLVGQKPQEACAIYPEFPDAQISWCFFKENGRDYELQKAVLDAAIKAMPDCSKLIVQRALIEIQYDEIKTNTERQGQYKYTNAIKRAEKWLAEADAAKPGNENYWHRKAIIEYVYKGNAALACECWMKGLVVNPSNYAEYMGYIGAARGGLKLPKKAIQSVGAPPKDTGVSMLAVPKLQQLSAVMKSAAPAQ